MITTTNQTSTIRHEVIDGLLIVKPTREDVQNLKVGDLAPNCFGQFSRVTEIYAQRDNIHGKAFVCFYTEFGSNGSTISGNLVEDEIVPTIPLTSRYLRSEHYPDPFKS